MVGGGRRSPSRRECGVERRRSRGGGARPAVGLEAGGGAVLGLQSLRGSGPSATGGEFVDTIGEQRGVADGGSSSSSEMELGSSTPFEGSDGLLESGSSDEDALDGLREEQEGSSQEGGATPVRSCSMQEVYAATLPLAGLGSARGVIAALAVPGRMEVDTAASRGGLAGDAGTSGDSGCDELLVTSASRCAAQPVLGTSVDKQDLHMAEACVPRGCTPSACENASKEAEVGNVAAALGRRDLRGGSAAGSGSPRVSFNDGSYGPTGLRNAAQPVLGSSVDKQDLGMVDAQVIDMCTQGVRGIASVGAVGELPSRVAGGSTIRVEADDRGRRQPPAAPGGGSNPWRRPMHTKVVWDNDSRQLNAEGDVLLDNAAVLRNRQRLEMAVVGKILGKKVPFAVLLGELRRKWLQFGSFRLVTTGDDCFTCLFESVAARDAVLMGGPWFVGGSLVGLDKWSPNFSPNSFSGYSAPVWVRFPLLPLLYWDNENLARMAARIGTPLWIDAQTSSWGRSSYARVCVRIDLGKCLPKGVWISGINGRFFQKVEYEGLSALCFQCGGIGHLAAKCPSLQVNPQACPGVGNPSGKSVRGVDGSCSASRGVQVGFMASGEALERDGSKVEGCRGMSNGTESRNEEEAAGWTVVSRRKPRPKGPSRGAGREGGKPGLNPPEHSTLATHDRPALEGVSSPPLMVPPDSVGFSRGIGELLANMEEEKVAVDAQVSDEDIGLDVLADEGGDSRPSGSQDEVLSEPEACKNNRRTRGRHRKKGLLQVNLVNMKSKKKRKASVQEADLDLLHEWPEVGTSMAEHFHGGGDASPVVD